MRRQSLSSSPIPTASQLSRRRGRRPASTRSRNKPLMTSCTLLWKELSDHFTSLEQDLLKKSEALNKKMETLDSQTTATLRTLTKRETTIDGSVSLAVRKPETSLKAVAESDDVPEVDDSVGLILKLKLFCLKMDSLGFSRFVTVKKKKGVVGGNGDDEMVVEGRGDWGGD